MPLLDIRNLTIEFYDTRWPGKSGRSRFHYPHSEGEVRGLVGESGSGKSLIAKGNLWRD